MWDLCGSAHCQGRDVGSSCTGGIQFVLSAVKENFKIGEARCEGSVSYLSSPRLHFKKIFLVKTLCI